jgi:hypothetical protein
MRRRRHSLWEVSTDEESVWYCGRKYGWKVRMEPLDLEPSIGSSNICSCKTKVRALRQARALRAMVNGSIIVSHITYVHGRRMFLDYYFKG